MNVLICGGGIAGLALALCMSRRGHRVLVVEKAPSLRGAGYMIDFVGSGIDAAHRLGLGESLARIHYPIARLSFVDGQGRERISLPYPRLRKRLFDDRHFNFLRGDLERLLYEAIAENVEVRFGTSIAGFEQKDRVWVRLTDGSSAEFDLVVGADGVHSHVRRLLFGDMSFSRYLGCHAAAFIIDELRSPVVRDAFVTLTVPRRQVAVYPIHGGRTATFFLHRALRPVDDTSRDAALLELQREYHGMGWIVPELIERAATADSFYFDVVSQIEMPRWSEGRVVLLGDACQCVSLLAGQGASMAVAAAYVLAEELARGNEDIASALGRYERRLKPAIVAKQEAGRRIAHWFIPEDAFRLRIRDLGLRASLLPLVSSVVKRRFAAESVFEIGPTTS